MMQAVQCVRYASAARDAVEIRQVPSLKHKRPRKGMVLVEVLACGVDFVQTLLMQNKYQMKLPLPFTLGGEATGVVIAIGPQVRDINVGDLVTGGGFGCFTEYLELSANGLVKLDGQHNSNASATDPANVPSLYSYLTSLHALKYRANLQKGETLLVLGASGGVGSTAIQIGKNLGATIIAAASTEEKCETCKRLGADYTINYDKENLKLRVREITKQKNGVNVVFDPVGDRYCDPAVRSLAWHGRYVVIGFAAGTIPRVAVNLLLLKEASILGSALRESGMHDPTGSKREREELLQMFHDGKIVPFVSTVLPLEKAADALTLFQDRKVRGKVVLVTRAYEEKYGRPWKGIVRRGKL